MSLKNQLIQLWKETFGDSDDFIRLFFTYIYKEENAIVITDNNKVTSALHVVPYHMHLNGERLKGGYICGVATIPEERGKGHMRTLMILTENIMRERGLQFLSLIPAEHWLFDYYRKSGYKSFFNYSIHIHILSGEPIDKNPIKCVDIKNCDTSELYDFFSKETTKRNGYLTHTFSNFEIILKDLYISKGNLYIYKNNNRLSGMAFVYPENNHRLIKEIIYTTPEVKHKLLNYITIQENTPVNYRLPAEPQNSIPYGMIRELRPGILTDNIQTQGYMSLMLD